MVTIARNSFFYWPVAVALGRGVGLLLSWLWREAHAVGWPAWARGVPVAGALGYICYLLGGLTREHFRLSWWVAWTVVAMIAVVQLVALRILRRWAAENGASLT
jgi:hypothetical protein